MTWVFIICAALMTAACAAVLGRPLGGAGDEKTRLALTAAVPLAAIALYLFLGNPGLPGAW